MNMKFNTENKTFRNIMGNGIRYTVPKFQRDYTWNTEQWEDLWQDLEALEEGEQHYMGYLVLQTPDDRALTIIDGQQRLTTISIVIITVLYQLQNMIENDIEPEENKLRLSTLQNAYIGFTDPVSLATHPKLTLNRNNDTFFRSYLCALDQPPIRGIKASERLLARAREYFEAKLNEKDFKTGAELAKFIDDLVDKMLFTTITVGDDLNAYKVFETLNARGVQLSVPDLLKNYMFSVIDAGRPLHDEELRKLEEDWEEISGQLRDNDFTRFIHAEWSSQNVIVPKSQLFKRIKQTITDRDTAFQYIRGLRLSSEVYAALQDSHDEFWHREEYKDVTRHLATLNLFNVVQPHGLLIAAYHKFPPEKFVKITGYISVLTMRYNIIGSRPANEQERVYNKIAQGISANEITNLQNVKRGLKELYPNDKTFKADFINKHMKTIRTPKKARYILAQLEQQTNGNLPVEDLLLTLEHVLPQNPEGFWVDYFGEGWEDSITMLGNMTLISKGDNQEMARKTFTEKKEFFTRSSMQISQKISEYDDWNRNAVEDRQNWLAGLAVSRWKIQF